MEVLETKIMRIENSESEINRVTGAMSCFGWVTQNIQITHSENTKTYSSAWDQMGGNKTQTVETTTINYATVTFQRNKAMSNYVQICNLESEFFRIESLKAELSADFERENSVLKILVKFTLASVFWPITIIRWMIKNSNGKSSPQKNAPSYYERQQAYIAQQEEICRRAEALLV